MPQTAVDALIIKLKAAMAADKTSDFRALQAILAEYEQGAEMPEGQATCFADGKPIKRKKLNATD